MTKFWHHKFSPAYVLRGKSIIVCSSLEIRQNIITLVILTVETRDRGIKRLDELSSLAIKSSPTALNVVAPILLPYPILLDHNLCDLITGTGYSL